MEFLMDYILKGKGRGLKFLTLFSVVMALVLTAIGYFQVKSYLKSEQIQQFVNTVPLLDVQDGRLVAPENAYVVLRYPDANEIFIVIDTRSEQQMDLNQFESVVYLVPERFYMKAGNQIEVASYPEEMEITPAVLHQTIDDVLIWGSLISIVSWILMIWFGYLFLYLLTRLFVWIIKQQIPAAVVSRVVSLSWMNVLTFYLLFLLFGVVFTLQAAFVLSFVLIGLLLLKITAQNTTPTNL